MRNKVIICSTALLGFMVLPALAIADPVSNNLVVRLAVLGETTENSGFQTNAISVSIGAGEGFKGITFGDPTNGSVGTAVGSGDTLFFIDGELVEASVNPYVTNTTLQPPPP